MAVIRIYPDADQTMVIFANEDGVFLSSYNRENVQFINIAQTGNLAFFQAGNIPILWPEHVYFEDIKDEDGAGIAGGLQGVIDYLNSFIGSSEGEGGEGVTTDELNAALVKYNQIEYIITTPTQFFNATHNLNKRPDVRCYDEDGYLIGGELRWPDKNNIEITWFQDFTGVVTVN